MRSGCELPYDGAQLQHPTHPAAVIEKLLGDAEGGRLLFEPNIASFEGHNHRVNVVPFQQWEQLNE